MSCLSADVVLRFVEGRLGPERVSEIEAHTGACAVCLDLLVMAASDAEGVGANGSETEPGWSSSSIDLRPVPTAYQELAAGSTVGRYLLIGLVGRGGMGEIYSAYDPELDRRVAIKLLNIEAASGGSAAEARARLLLRTG